MPRRACDHCALGGGGNRVSVGRISILLRMYSALFYWTEEILPGPGLCIRHNPWRFPEIARRERRSSGLICECEHCYVLPAGLKR